MKYIKRSLSAILSAIIVFSYVPKYNLKQDYKKLVNYNIHNNADNLNLYGQFLDEYVKYVRSLNLNDLDLIIKLMNDIWSEVQGYGVPDETIVGLYNLSFITEGKGVCTSFADEFTNRINRIDYRYNARNIILENRENNNVNIERIDINRNIINESNTESMNYSKHMVTAIDLIEKKCTLIVDTTNLMLGVLKNGKIYMFNSNNYLYNYLIEDNYIFSNKTLYDVADEYFDSFLYTSSEIEQLNEEFGIKSQIQSYNYINELPKHEKKLSKILIN